jgi:uncharacterized protein YjbI with pentapeptide repeats
MIQIKGMRFSQKSLKPNLEGVSAGQSTSTKATIALMLIFSCALSSFLTGFFGSDVIFSLVTGSEKAQLSRSIVMIVVIVWLVTATYMSPRKNVLITLFVLLIGVAAQQWAIKAFPENFQNFSWIDILYDVLNPLTIIIISYFAIRFSIAEIYVLWRRITTSTIKIFLTIFIVLASILGAYSGLSLRSDSNPKFVEIIADTSQTTVLAGGILLSCAVALSAWLANRFRNAPWDHTGFLHPLVLSAGCWKGTSFYDLDLSQVSFRGANLANSDLRARKLYRTCLQGVVGLEKAQIDSHYLDLELPQVQRLVTQGYSKDTDFRRLNLRGAYLQGADLRRLNFTDADLSGSDFKSADVRGAILARANMTGVDFSDANLTGICIQDWNVNRETLFTNVLCDYIYRKLDEQAEPTDRYPLDRNFDEREFESLYQEVENVVELVFKEGVNWRAFAFTLQKLQLEDEGLGLELKGIEKRGDLWIVKVTHDENVSTSVVEQHLGTAYDRLQQLLSSKEQQIAKLLDIASDQAETMKSLSKQSFGNNFFISGSTITNLAGSGQIEYREAADRVRSIVTNRAEASPTMQQLFSQMSAQNVATTAATQQELMQQILLSEAEQDPAFRQFLLEQGQQVMGSLPNGEIAIALQNAIAQLKPS